MIEISPKGRGSAWRSGHMQRAAIASVIGGLVAIYAPAANAQDVYKPTGTRIGQARQTADPDFARRMLKTTAACVSRLDSAGVVALLRGDSHAALNYAAAGIQNEDDHSPLELSQCLTEAMNGSQVVMEMRIPPRALRTVLAEEAYLKRHSAPLEIAAGSPRVLVGRAVIGGETAAQSQALGIFADCLVFNAPNEADRLVRGPVGGTTERDNARALSASISQCITAGQQANFSTSAIRDIVADGLWARSEFDAARVAGE